MECTLEHTIYCRPSEVCTVSPGRIRTDHGFGTDVDIPRMTHHPVGIACIICGRTGEYDRLCRAGSRSGQTRTRIELAARNGVVRVIIEIAQHNQCARRALQIMDELLGLTYRVRLQIILEKSLDMG